MITASGINPRPWVNTHFVCNSIWSWQFCSLDFSRTTIFHEISVLVGILKQLYTPHWLSLRSHDKLWIVNQHLRHCTRLHPLKYYHRRSPRDSLCYCPRTIQKPHSLQNSPWKSSRRNAIRVSPYSMPEVNSFEGQVVPRFITNTTRGLERHFHPTLAKFENTNGMI